MKTKFYVCALIKPSNGKPISMGGGGGGGGRKILTDSLAKLYGVWEWEVFPPTRQ